MSKNLTKSNKDFIIFGVAGGLAQHFNVSSLFLRIIFVILAFPGIGILAYVILAIAMPSKQTSNNNNFNNMEENKPNKGNGNLVAGVTLIALGIVFLIDKYFVDIEFRDIWPFVLIIAGIVILIGGRNK